MTHVNEGNNPRHLSLVCDVSITPNEQTRQPKRDNKSKIPVCCRVSTSGVAHLQDMKLIVFATSALVLLAGCSASDSSQSQANTTGVTPPARAAPSPSSPSSGPASDGLLFGGRDPADEPVDPSPFHQDRDAVEPHSPTIPTGTDAYDIAARVALSAYLDPDWALSVTSDLDPAYAALAEADRRGTDTTREFGLLQLITVDAAVDDPNTLFVAFDEITDAQSVRHISIVTLDDAAASRPLVIDVEPVA